MCGGGVCVSVCLCVQERLNGRRKDTEGKGGKEKYDGVAYRMDSEKVERQIMEGEKEW